MLERRTKLENCIDGMNKSDKQKNETIEKLQLEKEGLQNRITKMEQESQSKNAIYDASQKLYKNVIRTMGDFDYSLYYAGNSCQINKELSRISTVSGNHQRAIESLK